MPELTVVQNVLLVAFVLTVMWTDWRTRRIPNVVTYPAMLVGVVLAGLQAFPGAFFDRGLLDHVAGVVIAFVLAYPFYAAGGMKAGDGKLLMAVAALKGTVFLLYAAVLGALIGGFIAIGYIAVRRIAALASGRAVTIGQLMRSWIPYGIALGLGALAALAVVPS